MISKNELREPGEGLALFFGMIALLTIGFVFLDFNAWVTFLLVIGSLGYILIIKRQMYGNSLLVSDQQFPHIHKIAEDISTKLGIVKPTIFIEQNPYLNAYAFGFKKPYMVVLSSSLVEGLTDSELYFVIAHEIGHIYLGHTRWLSIISPLGNNNFFLSLLYGSWQRKSEYSADKIGFITLGDLKVVVTALIKITVGPKLEKKVKYSGILDQIMHGEQQKGADIGEVLMTHPYVLNRIEKLMLFNTQLKKESEVV